MSKIKRIFCLCFTSCKVQSMDLFLQTGISLKNSLAASLLAQMFLPPSSSLSPFAVPSVCHLLSHFSDLFMKYVCTTPFAMAAVECWNCDQAYFLFPFVEFVSSSPLDSGGVSGLVLNVTKVVSSWGCPESFCVRTGQQCKPQRLGRV